MTEPKLGPSHAGSVVLDIGGDTGALILQTPAEMLGREIDVTPLSAPEAHGTHSLVRERQVSGTTTYAAVYPALPVGDYIIWRTGRPRSALSPSPAARSPATTGRPDRNSAVLTQPAQPRPACPAPSGPPNPTRPAPSSPPSPSSRPDPSRPDPSRPATAPGRALRLRGPLGRLAALAPGVDDRLLPVARAAAVRLEQRGRGDQVAQLAVAVAARVEVRAAGW